MALKQGDLALLEHPVAKELLASNIPARMAYVATDGTPRVLPIWFHWDGRQLVMGTQPNAAKLKALTQNPKVAITIDDNTLPHKVLLIRGPAHLDTVEGVCRTGRRPRNDTSDPKKGKPGSSRSAQKVGGRRALQSHRNGPESWISRHDFHERWQSEAPEGITLSARREGTIRSDSSRSYAFSNQLSPSQIEPRTTSG